MRGTPVGESDRFGLSGGLRARSSSIRPVGPVRAQVGAMKIGILSDIHAHRHEQEAEVRDLIEHINAAPVPDLLVFAGDISHRTGEILAFLERIEVPCPKCWVPGNHDIWVIDAESADDSPWKRYRQTFNLLSERTGWHYLPERPFVFSGTGLAVVGTIGWFTDDGYSEWFDADATEKDRELALLFMNEIRDQIRALDDGADIVLVSHHLVHADTPVIGRKKGASRSAFMEELFVSYQSRITAVIHGHVHRRYDPVSIVGVPFCAHPFGYPGEHGCVEDGYRVIEVDGGIRG
jgi:3',5'-cyclic AMP phosphodiesterase CpdA